MKLYTEEQVREMIEKSRETGLTADYLILANKGIEIPSDEEIEQIADACHPYAEQIGGDIYVAYRAFKQGLQLMRDKIQGDNK